MKVRLKVVEAELHKNMKTRGLSSRRYAFAITANVRSEEDKCGTEIVFNGTRYIVVEQFPSRMALNAMRKRKRK